MAHRYRKASKHGEFAGPGMLSSFFLGNTCQMHKFPCSLREKQERFVHGLGSLYHWPDAGP